MLRGGAMLVGPYCSWLTYPLMLLFLVNLALFGSSFGRALSRLCNGLKATELANVEPKTCIGD